MGLLRGKTKEALPEEVLIQVSGVTLDRLGMI